MSYLMIIDYFLGGGFLLTLMGRFHFWGVRCFRFAFDWREITVGWSIFFWRMGRLDMIYDEMIINRERWIFILGRVFFMVVMIYCLLYEIMFLIYLFQMVLISGIFSFFEILDYPLRSLRYIFINFIQQIFFYFSFLYFIYL
jgi:hypothetical protein